MRDDLKKIGDMEQDFAMRLVVADSRATVVAKLAANQAGTITALAVIDARETISPPGRPGGGAEIQGQRPARPSITPRSTKR